MTRTTDSQGKKPSVAPEAERPRCQECGAESPQTNTNYTLISKQHGWRLALQDGADGRRVAHWRCPKCWERHRKLGR